MIVDSHKADFVIRTYEDIAAEYYDQVRHPTCSNLREASEFLLRRWLLTLSNSQPWCEVGAGKSSLAELISERNSTLHDLLLVDSSPSMLAYSRQWGKQGANLVLGDANALPIGSNSLGLLVSSLGDPYNEPRFWKEVCRTLRSGGSMFFTTPAYDWAVAFRSQQADDRFHFAEFALSDGRHLWMRSRIYPVKEQIQLIECAGLTIKEFIEVPVNILNSTHLSAKLMVERGLSASIVTGYLVQKCKK